MSPAKGRSTPIAGEATGQGKAPLATSHAIDHLRPSHVLDVLEPDPFRETTAEIVTIPAAPCQGRRGPRAAPDRTGD